jgi:GDP-L-fucose synthase
MPEATSDNKTEYRLAGKRVWVAGHQGMAGSALVRRLSAEGCECIVAGRGIVDLRRQNDTEAWMEEHRPDAVIVAAATVGGILANMQRPAEFIYDNLTIAANVIHGAHRIGVEKLMFLGSSCIYPRLAPQPMNEDLLLTGPLESSNEAYAVAKIAAIKLCQAYRTQYGSNFIAVQPTNLYGPGDRFDVEQGHVVAGLLLKAHEARLTGASALTVWGTGTPRREFLYVDDFADAAIHVMKTYSGPVPLNIGTGSDVSIRDLASLVCSAVGFEGCLVFDTTKPDGTPRKLLDVGRLKALNWSPSTTLADGLAKTYRWFVEHRAAA